MNFYSGVLTGIVGLYLSLILGGKLVVWRYRRRLAREFAKIDKCHVCKSSGTQEVVYWDQEKMTVRVIRLCGVHLEHEMEVEQQ